MIRNFSILIVFATLALPAFAQSPESKERLEKTRQYVIRKIVKVRPGHFSDLPPIETRLLTEAEVKAYRNQGYRVELNRKMELFRVTSSWRIGSAMPSKPLWFLDAIRAKEANKLPNGDGKGVTICLVDTGVAKTHPTLAGQIVGGENFSGVGDPTDYSDVQGHGTLLAGIIAGKDVGNFRGVAAGAKILVAKVFHANGGGDYAAIAKGIQYCIGRSQIINLSFGSHIDSAIVTDILDQAMEGSNMSVIAAAGNGGPISFPARLEGVLSVGAIDPNINVAPFSARGTMLGCVAPGESIFGPTLLGYSVFSGTSISSAIVSAVEAIRLARRARSLEMIDLGKPQTDQGFGLVDAELTAR